MEKNKHQPIPSEFYNSDTGVPFTHCTFCESDLGQLEYVIEKKLAPRKGIEKPEVVYEFAMCMSCMVKLNEEMSQETRTKLQQYQEELRDKFEGSEESDLNRCFFEGKPMTDYSEFELVGLFKENAVSDLMSPYGVGGAIMEEMQELISEKTQDAWDDFSSNLTGVPPEWQDLFDKPPVLV
jgi:hypothetical protein